MKNTDLRQLAEKALATFVSRKDEAAAWEGQKVVIYGAGVFGRDLARVLPLKSKVTLLGFLDQKGAGQVVLDDFRAHRLESATAAQWLAEKPVVIIGVHNYLASVREIKAQLIQFGFSRILTPMQVYPQLSKELGWRFWLGSQQDYASSVSSIEHLGTLWADAESQHLFYETLLYRLGIEMEEVAPLTDVSLQYAVPTMPRWKSPLRLVDGGAYTGDTLQSLLQHGYDFAAIHAFEPDAVNFKRLCLTASAFTPETQISLWPCGLWSSTCRMSFSEGFEMGSKLTEVGPTTVPVVALDDILHGQPVNLIKMDIEGAEADALRGAQHLIQKYRPGLAICLYHHPQHLWSIPLWVEGLKLDYRFYCRTHAHNTFDMVLYAMPK
ncbi:MAG TPA: FkbM family methyltransferase [Candidatus Cybelea sp.]|jgi:FkbM family methyltransferase|nr:FkbM family methyltransferase [Candidatus Cybelea sp.]